MFKASVSDNRPIRHLGLAASPESRSDGNLEMRMALCEFIIIHSFGRPFLRSLDYCVVERFWLDAPFIPRETRTLVLYSRRVRRFSFVQNCSLRVFDSLQLHPNTEARSKN
jgi:hypothetical protein